MNAATRFAIPRSAAALNSTRKAFNSSRTLHFRSTAHLQKKEDLMDKDALNPTSTEYSKTGEGDGQAAQESVAFDPSTTDPDTEHNESSNKTGGESENPLNVSPGNEDVNGDQDQAGEGRKNSEGAAGRKGSERSSPRKHGGASTG